MNILKHIKSLNSTNLNTLLEQLDHLTLYNYSTTTPGAHAIAPTSHIGMVIGLIKEAATEQMENNDKGILLAQINEVLNTLEVDSPLANKLVALHNEILKQ